MRASPCVLVKGSDPGHADDGFDYSPGAIRREDESQRRKLNKLGVQDMKEAAVQGESHNASG